MKRIIAFVFCTIFTTSLFLNQGIIRVSGYENQNTETESVEVIDKEESVSTLTFENKSIELIEGEYIDVKYSLKSGKITDEDIILVSADENIAKLSGKQLIGVSAGKTIVTAMTKDSSIKEELEVLVNISSKNEDEEEIHIPNEVSKSERATAALHELIIAKGENYELNNTSSNVLAIETTATSKADRYDIIMYDSLDNIDGFSAGGYGRINLKPGYKMRISVSKGENIKLNIPYEFKDIYKAVKEPVFDVLNIEKGKNYEFNNTSRNALAIETTATSKADRYDIIMYDALDNIDGFSAGGYGRINLKPEYKMRISVSKGENVKLYIPYEFKDIYKAVKEPVFDVLNIEKGKNYEFNNSFNKKIQLPTTTTASQDSDKYDIIQYDANSNIVEVNRGAYGTISMKSEYKMRVSVSKGENIKLYIPYEFKSIYKEVKEPVFDVLNIEKGKNYELNNSSTKRIELLTTAKSGGNTYDIIKYDKNGDIGSASDAAKKDAVGGIYLDSGYKMRISVSRGEDVKLYIPYEFKDMYKEVKEPVFDVLNIEKGKNYEFHNSTNKKVHLLSTTTLYEDSDKYDIIQYDENSNIVKLNRGAYGAISMDSEYKMRISVSKGENIKLYIPYEFKSIYKEVKEPVFDVLNIEKGKNYEFHNSTNKKVHLLSTATLYEHSYRYDIIKYDTNSNIVEVNREAYGTISINSGYKMRISVSKGDNIKLYIPYEFKSIYKEVKEPVFDVLNIEKGKNYEFNNSFDNKIQLLTTATLYEHSYRYDIIQYDVNSNIVEVNREAYGTISINSGYKMRISASKGENIKLYIPYEFKSIYKEVKEPVFYEVDIKPRETYEFKNNLNTKTVILSNSDYDGNRYDLIKYNSKGTIISEIKNTYGKISLNSGEIAKVKLSKGGGLKFYLPYEVKDGKHEIEKEDINNDKVVDVLDLAQIGIYYNEKSDKAGYDKYDINKDGIIDIYDIILVAKKCA